MAAEEHSTGPEEFQLPEGFETDETGDLVRRAKDGDAQALNELFSRFHHTMVDMARRGLGARLRLKEEPDDLAQTTFREATRDFQNYQYRGEKSFLSWLVHILKNKIRDKAEFYSAGKRDISREREMDARPDGEGRMGITLRDEDPLTVTQHAAEVENFALLKQALDELSPEHRRAITLVFFQGMTLRQAGEAMGGRSEDAVRMMMRRAESKLGDLLKSSVGRDLKD